MTRPTVDSDVLDLRLVAPAVAAWVVAWQGRTLGLRTLLASAVVCLLLAVGVLALDHADAAVLAGVLVCACAAMIATGARSSARADGPLPGLAQRQAAVVVEGVLTEDPRLVPAATGDRAATVVVRVRVERVEAAGVTTQVRTPVLVLATDASWLPLLPSQHVRVEGRAAVADRGDDVAALISGRGPVTVLGPPSRVQRVAGHLRQGLRDAVEPLPDSAGGLLPGLVVGDTSHLLPEVKEDFTVVGLTHLTAVSGSNVAVVLAAVLGLARVTRLGVRATPALGALGLLAFVVLARPSPSVLRAAAMGVVALLALASGGRRRALPALSAAVLVLVLASPDLAASPGFALSVLATGGLLVVGPPLRQWLARGLPEWLAEAIAVPTAAQLACGPVVVAISGNLGLLSVPANLLAAVAVPPATVLGVAVALVAVVCPPLAEALAWLAWLPAAWLVLVAKVGADLPLAVVPWPDGGAGGFLLAAATLGAYGVLIRPRLRRVAMTAVVAASLALGALRYGLPAWPPPGWALVMCDVGQGDALVVRTGDHEALVVDAGPDPDTVDHCLTRLGIRAIPLVVLSHPHADHVDGLPGVLRGRAVGRIEVGPQDDPPAQAAKVAAWSASAGVPVARAALGEGLRRGAVRWTVLAPTRVYSGSGSDPNNESVVLRVTVGDVVILLAGDVEPEAQADLLAAGGDLRADVLKVPHHGSAHQDPDFLAAVAPRVALTSVGRGNDYGHPAARTLSQLTGQGARSYRTDQQGDIAVVISSGQLSVVAERGRG